MSLFKPCLLGQVLGGKIVAASQIVIYFSCHAFDSGKNAFFHISHQIVEIGGPITAAIACGPIEIFRYARCTSSHTVQQHASVANQPRIDCSTMA